MKKHKVNDTFVIYKIKGMLLLLCGWLSVCADNYWSGSAISAGSSGLAWNVNFNNGNRWQNNRTNGKYVRCVRRITIRF